MRAWHLLCILWLSITLGALLLLGSVSSGSSSHMRGGSPWPLHPARPQRPSPPSPQRAVHRAAAAPDGCPLVHTADPADPTTYAPATQSTQWAAVHCSPSTICAPRPFEAAFPRAMLLSDAGARAVDLEAWNAQGAAPVVAEPRRELAWATPPRAHVTTRATTTRRTRRATGCTSRHYAPTPGETLMRPLASPQTDQPGHGDHGAAARPPQQSSRQPQRERWRAAVIRLVQAGRTIRLHPYACRV